MCHPEKGVPEAAKALGVVNQCRRGVLWRL
jgi:hypothetical protein